MLTSTSLRAPHWAPWLRTLAATLFAALALCVPAASAQPNSSGDQFEILPMRTKVSPGDQVAVAVIISLDPGWHTHTNKPEIPPSWGDFPAKPTSITVLKPQGVKVGPLQYPNASEVFIDLAATGKPEPYLVYEGSPTIFIPLIIEPNATTVSFDLHIEYQSCNDSVCEMPVDQVRTVTLEVVPPGGIQTATTSSVFSDFDNSVFGKMLQEGAKYEQKSAFDFFGYKFEVNTNSYLIILIIAFVAGFLLNLTPCVLPVVPLKVLSLQKQAGNPVKLALYGTIYCIGIVTTFVVLGFMIFGIVTGGQKQDWGQLFSNPWFTIVMAAIVAAMALSLLGLFTLKLPDSIYMFSPTNDSAAGNFLMGVLTAILSTPCTGPLLGATIAWAFTQPAWMGLATFSVMGLGMASPYAALIAFPKLMNRLPKAGPGAELLKQVLGVFLFAVAAFIASNLTLSRWTWWIVGALACAALLWAIIGAWRMLRTTRGKQWVTAFASIALVLTAWGTTILADEGPIPWRLYANKPNEKLFEDIKKATAAGKTVVVDFTAKWCTNCHVIEKAVLHQEDAVKLLTAPTVETFRVDLSRATPETGWGAVKQISGGGGIPLIAIYRPNQPTPVFFNSFFKVSDLAKAMETPVATNLP